MLGIWNVEWLDSNSNRSYPLADDAGKVDTTGTFTLPDSFLVGLYLPVHAGLAVDPRNFFVRSVGVSPAGYSVSVAYDDGGSDPPVVASASVARSTHREYDAYPLPGIGDFADTLGKLVLGDTSQVDLQPPGLFLFSPAGGKLDVDCVRPQIRGISSLTVVSGPDRSPRIYGDVELVAGANMRIVPVRIGETNQIRFDAVDGGGLSASCECQGDSTQPPPIRTINGIPVGSDGNFNILGSDCLNVGAAAGGIRLTDTCSAPCCGCPELEALTQELAHVGDQARTLIGVVDRLKGSVDQTAMVVLGSRLNDDGCITCV